MAEKLTGSTRKSVLAKLDGWSEVEGRDAISKKFAFKDFNEAFVYNEVEVTLATHDAGGVTERDVKLAEAMDRLTKALR